MSDTGATRTAEQMVAVTCREIERLRAENGRLERAVSDLTEIAQRVGGPTNKSWMDALNVLRLLADIPPDRVRDLCMRVAEKAKQPETR